MTIIKKAFLSSIFLFLSLPVLAVPFQSGGFTSASGWVDSSFTGTAQVTNGEAILETADSTDPYSAVLVQGDDGTFSFSNPITLTNDVESLFFDAEFINLGFDGTELGLSLFSDALFVLLYDSDGSNFDFSTFTDPDDLLVDHLIDASISGMNTYQFDVSSMAGLNIALSFELSDEDDGFNSRIILDNIRFETASIIGTPIPEPPPLALLGLGVLSLFVTRSKRK